MYTGGTSSSRTSMRPVSVFGNAVAQKGDNSMRGLALSGEVPQGHVVHGEKKVFEESLWIMGKLLGTVRGTFFLENLPVMQ